MVRSLIRRKADHSQIIWRRRHASDIIQSLLPSSFPLSWSHPLS